MQRKNFPTAVSEDSIKYVAALDDDRVPVRE